MTCNLCGASGVKPLFSKFGFRIVECRGCGLQRIGDMPSDEEIAAWYDEGYYTGDPERRGYLSYVGEREILVESFLDKLDRVERFLSRQGAREGLSTQDRKQNGRKQRVLDVGTAAGWFLEAAAQRGWDASGTEVSEYAWSEARRHGLEVVHGDSLEPFAGQQFDLITMWDVVEHVRDPMGLLREARGLLREDGMLVFSTGDVDNVWSRVQGRRNRIYNPPQHLYYFSRRTMTELARRAGFDVVRVEPDEKVTTLHYVLHIARNLIDLKAVAWLVGRLMRFLPNPKLRMKLSDNLVVYARPAAAAPAERDKSDARSGIKPG